MTKSYVGFADIDRNFEDSLFWDAHGEHGVDSSEYCRFVEGAHYGAAWMAAIISMAEAIRCGRFCAVCGKHFGGPSGDPYVCRWCCGC